LQAQVDQLYYTWFRCCHPHGLEHAVLDEVAGPAIVERTGEFEAVCGHVVLPALAIEEPGDRCMRCVIFLRARATLPDIRSRLDGPRLGRRRLRRRWIPFPRTPRSIPQSAPLVQLMRPGLDGDGPSAVRLSPAGTATVTNA
jgi:hypothetical protein